VQALDIFNSITDALKYFLACIAAVSLIVGGIGITNIMLMTVKERTREIGLRKAVGANPSQIKNQFIIETLVITTIGGLIGIIFGISVAYIIAKIMNSLGYDWEFIVTLNSALLAFFISISLGLLFGIYPAKKAAMKNPIEALRYE
jgi:putative ABC transport system permease protein